MCESGDWIGRDRALAVQPGDLLAVLSAGAYCMSMASNYNTRGRAAEVLVDGDQRHLIRGARRVDDQMRSEQLRLSDARHRCGCGVLPAPLQLLREVPDAPAQQHRQDGGVDATSAKSFLPARIQKKCRMPSAAIT